MGEAARPRGERDSDARWSVYGTQGRRDCGRCSLRGAARYRTACSSVVISGLSRCWVRSSRLQVNVTSGSDARSGAPCLESLGAEPTLRCRRDEMATDGESVINRSMCREESLSRSGGTEALHLSLSSSHRDMRALCPVVLSQASLVGYQ